MKDISVSEKLAAGISLVIISNSQYKITQYDRYVAYDATRG